MNGARTVSAAAFALDGGHFLHAHVAFVDPELAHAKEDAASVDSSRNVARRCRLRVLGGHLVVRAVHELQHWCAIGQAHANLRGGATRPTNSTAVPQCTVSACYRAPSPLPARVPASRPCSLSVIALSDLESLHRAHNRSDSRVLNQQRLVSSVRPLSVSRLRSLFPVLLSFRAPSHARSLAQRDPASTSSVVHRSFSLSAPNRALLAFFPMKKITGGGRVPGRRCREC